MEGTDDLIRSTFSADDSIKFETSVFGEDLNSANTVVLVGSSVVLSALLTPDSSTATTSDLIQGDLVYIPKGATFKLGGKPGFSGNVRFDGVYRSPANPDDKQFNETVAHWIK